MTTKRRIYPLLMNIYYICFIVERFWYSLPFLMDIYIYICVCLNTYLHTSWIILFEGGCLFLCWLYIYTYTYYIHLLVIYIYIYILYTYILYYILYIYIYIYIYICIIYIYIYIYIYMYIYFCTSLLRLVYPFLELLEFFITFF